MATGIEEHLAERGLTMSILEAVDEGLRRTKQVRLDQYGVIPGRGAQTTLPVE
tara:strand:- start:167 stop:325 length:159 start_codon:yes stop_codon:yes gene_type:complete